MSTPNVTEMPPELQYKRHPVGGHAENGKLCFDCAGASGSKVGPFRKPQKNKENATCEPSRSGGRFFIGKVTKSDIQRKPFGTILMAEAAQARDKPAPRSHHAQDMRKHVVLMAQGFKRCKTRVLEAPGRNSAAGAAHLLGWWENDDLALKSKLLLGFWLLLQKVGGCRRLKN